MFKSLFFLFLIVQPFMSVSFAMDSNSNSESDSKSKKTTSHNIVPNITDKTETNYKKGFLTVALTNAFKKTDKDTKNLISQSKEDTDKLFVSFKRNTIKKTYILNIKDTSSDSDDMSDMLQSKVIVKENKTNGTINNEPMMPAQIKTVLNVDKEPIVCENLLNSCLIQAIDTHEKKQEQPDEQANALTNSVIEKFSSNIVDTDANVEKKLEDNQENFDNQINKSGLISPVKSVHNDEEEFNQEKFDDQIKKSGLISPVKSVHNDEEEDNQENFDDQIKKSDLISPVKSVHNDDDEEDNQEKALSHQDELEEDNQEKALSHQDEENNSQEPKEEEEEINQSSDAGK